MKECESMNKMFAYCESLEIIPLYSIKNGANIDNIFYNCHNLLWVYICDENINHINIAEIFKYCPKLQWVYVKETILDNIKKEFSKINISPEIKTFQNKCSINQLNSWLSSYREDILIYCKNKKNK